MTRSRHIFSAIRNLYQEVNSLPGVCKRDEKIEETFGSLEYVVTDSELHDIIAQLYAHGHHAEAVKKAFVFVNNLVKKKSQNTGLDGADLMRTTFSPKNPTLYLNELSSQSERDEQLGYMEIFAGVMTGIRNPRAHEHDWEDTEERALQLLSIANHLVLRIRSSRKKT